MRLIFALVVALAVPAHAQEGVDHTAVVAQVKAELAAKGVDLSSPHDSTPCNVFQITKRVAWMLRGEGVGLVKKGGNNCDGYSTDALMYRSGAVYDLLVGSGETNGPTWNRVGTRPLSDWAAPFDPGDIPPPPPAGDLAAVLRRLDQLETSARNAQLQLSRAADRIEGVADQVTRLAHAVTVLEARPIFTRCRPEIFGRGLKCELLP